MSARDDVRARVREAGGDELCERLDHLEKVRSERFRPPAACPMREVVPDAPARGARPDYDVVLAGGGLSLLLAPLLADRGLSVAVADRARAGSAHREWNAGEREIQALAATGLFTGEEIEGFVVARYDHGVCRWHGGGSYPVSGVLDCAFDARALLTAARARAEERGVHLFDGHALAGHAAGPDAVALIFDVAGHPPREMSAGVLVDARGASSPYATADLICPTVGGVVTGLDVPPDVGDILATTEGVDAGVQHIWEAFPGRSGEVAVYLFHYARSGDVPGGALMDLYARFFERLPIYKRGEARLLRPTFGYIPGWSRLAPPPRSPGPRVMLVGDAAARHSPLTFCGFGSTVRSLASTADAIARRVSGLAPEAIADAPIHAGTGALAALMAAPPRDPARRDELNDLLDVAFKNLHALGNDAYAALLRDEMAPADFVRFLRATAAERPRVYLDVWRSLRPREVGRWGAGLVRELWRARA